MESCWHAHEIIQNQQALLDAVKESATGIENINETLKQLLDDLANKISA